METHEVYLEIFDILCIINYSAIVNAIFEFFHVHRICDPSTLAVAGDIDIGGSYT
jgi:hypothetical protein